jgi:hypothetical protein
VKGKTRSPRWDNDGYPANRSAKRDLGIILQCFGTFGAVYQKPKQEPEFYLIMQIGVGMPGKPSKRLVSICTVRLSVIQDSIKHAVELHEKKYLKDTELEIVLDYLYIELHRRVNV